MPPFKKSFLLIHLTDSIKLLTWCVSSAVLFHYMSETLATAMQLGKNVQSIAAASKPEGSPALDPSSSLVHPTGTSPPLKPLLLDIPVVGTPPVGHPFLGFIADPYPKRWATLLVLHLVIIVTRGPISASQRLRLKVNTALLRVKKTHPIWYWRLDLVLNNESPIQSN